MEKEDENLEKVGNNYCHDPVNKEKRGVFRYGDRWEWETDSDGWDFSVNVSRCNYNSGPCRAGPPSTMIAFFLNCCGLRAPRTVRNLKTLSQQIKPHVIFLSETHLSIRNMDRVRQQLYFKLMYVSEPWWKRSFWRFGFFVDGRDHHVVKYFLNIPYIHGGSNDKMWITGFYGDLVVNH